MHVLALPIGTLVIVVSAQMIRMTRAGILNVMSSAYIEMAILKGIPRRRIILRHALFNAIGPIVNVIALNLAYLVSGVVVVETIFAYPGLAKLMVDGVQTRDIPLVQACGMIFCCTYVVLILIADVAAILSTRLGILNEWKINVNISKDQFKSFDAPPKSTIRLSWVGKFQDSVSI